MIEVTIERALYAAVEDDVFDGIVRQCHGFASSYVVTAPTLRRVLIFEVTKDVYAMVGMFEVEPSEEERQEFSCLCTELMTYDSSIGRHTIVVEKVVYPGGIREPYENVAR